MRRRLLPLTLAVLVVLVTTLAGAAIPAAAQGTSGTTATLTITFLSCPPGGDWFGPPAGCAEVVPAPETATLTGPDWIQPVHQLQPNADGSYTVPNVPAGAGAGEIGLANFFSPDHNAFTFSGTDVITRWYGGVTLAPGESRDITVFYWNGPVDLIMPPENTLTVNLHTCGEGIDPAASASGCEPYAGQVPPGLSIGTSPLRGIQLEDYLSRDGGTLTYAGLPAYTQAQVVAHEPMTGYASTLVTGGTEEGRGDSATAFLLRNESATIDVFFYDPTGETRAGTWTLSPDEGEGGTLRLLMLGCPPGVVPHDDPGACTETLEDDGSAMVTFDATGERVRLARFERDEAGAYVITGIDGSVTISGIVPTDGTRIASDADTIDGDTIAYTVPDGEVRDGRLYYFTGN